MPVLPLNSSETISPKKAAPTRLAHFWWLPGPLLAFLAYLPALACYFTGEDFIFVRFVTSGKAFYAPSQDLFYRPLPNLLWQLDWSLWGLQAPGYHLTNLLLHALNATLVGVLARQLGLNRMQSGLAAGLFALLPIHTEAVVWLAGRPDLLATACALAALICTHRYFAGYPGGRLWYWLGVVAFGLGLFCKESVVTLPLVMLAWAVWQRKPRRVRQWLGLLVRFGPHLALLIVWFAVRWQVLGGLGGYGDGSNPVLRLLWNATLGLWLPLLFPLNVESAGLPLTILLGLALAALYGWLIWGKRRWLLSGSAKFALALLYLSLLPALVNAPISLNLAQSRILYLPSVGFCLLLSGWLNYGHEAASTSISRGRFWLIPLAGLGLLWVGALVLAVLPWWQAGTTVQTTLDELTAHRLDLRPGDNVYYEGLPDNFQGAYIWRNGLAEATALVVSPGVNGLRYTPDLLVDYRLAQTGRLWFVRYQPRPITGLPSYAFSYWLDNAAQPVPKLTHQEDLTRCQAPFQWEMQSYSQIVCQSGQGRQLQANGQKTNLDLLSPVITPQNSLLYVDLTANLDYDFSQPQVLAEITLTDAQNQTRFSQPFYLPADGKLHHYRLRLPVSASSQPYRVRIHLSKFRDNILWQSLGWSE